MPNHARLGVDWPGAPVGNPDVCAHTHGSGDTEFQTCDRHHGEPKAVLVVGVLCVIFRTCLLVLSCVCARRATSPASPRTTLRPPSWRNMIRGLSAVPRIMPWFRTAIASGVLPGGEDVPGTFPQSSVLFHVLDGHSQLHHSIHTIRHLVPHLLAYDTSESMDICGKQPTLGLLINHTLGLLIVHPADCFLTHLPAAISKLFRSFHLTLDHLLETGVVVLIRELVTEPL